MRAASTKLRAFEPSYTRRSNSAKLRLIDENEKARRAGGPFACRTLQIGQPAPSRPVTARRFCDQQEMSSQTATGRSLP
jgi:hypothetical protein